MMAASSILFLFSLILFNLFGASLSMEKCTTQSCNSSATFSVSFPFQLPTYQPDRRCGFSSDFTLACSPSFKQTLLYLPKSGYFVIEDIDYSLQKVTLTDPYGCFPGRFLEFRLSDSPFSSPYSKKYSYYNCTRKAASGSLSRYEVPCMSDAYYAVIAILSGTIENEVWAKNCTVIKTFISAPIDLYLHRGQITYLDLYWVKPDCRACLTNGQVCGFKDFSNLIECQGFSKSRLSPQALIGFVMGILVPVFLVVLTIVAVAAYIYRFISSQTQALQFNQQETQLVHTQASTTAAIIIESSNPVFVLGEGDVLLEPNVSPCAICLCEYKAGDMLRTIQDCNHYFHSNCVDEWLKMSATCPVCRKGA